MNAPLGNNYSHLDIMVPFALSHIHQRRPRFLLVQMIFGRVSGLSVLCQDKLIKLYFVSLHLLSKLFLNWIGQVDFRLTRAFWRIFQFSVSGLQKYIFYFISYKNSGIDRRFISICRNAFWNGNGNGFMLANLKIQKTRQIPRFSIRSTWPIQFRSNNPLFCKATWCWWSG
jgi:hypothetical protein